MNQSISFCLSNELRLTACESREKKSREKERRERQTQRSRAKPCDSAEAQSPPVSTVLTHLFPLPWIIRILLYFQEQIAYIVRSTILNTSKKHFTMHGMPFKEIACESSSHSPVSHLQNQDQFLVLIKRRTLFSHFVSCADRLQVVNCHRDFICCHQYCLN